MAIGTATVINLREVRRVKRQSQGLSVSLSKFVSGKQSSSRLVTREGDQSGVDSVVAFLSVEGNAAQGTPRQDPFEQDMAARAQAVKMSAALQAYLVHYVYSAELGSVEILLIIRKKPAPPPRSVVVRLIDNRKNASQRYSVRMPRRLSRGLLLFACACGSLTLGLIPVLHAVKVVYDEHVRQVVAKPIAKVRLQALATELSSSFEYKIPSSGVIANDHGLFANAVTGISTRQIAMGGGWERFAQTPTSKKQPLLRPQIPVGERIDYAVSDLAVETAKLLRPPTEDQMFRAFQAYMNKQLENARLHVAEAKLPKRQHEKKMATHLELLSLKSSHCYHSTKRSSENAFECSITVVVEGGGQRNEAILTGQFAKYGLEYQLTKIVGVGSLASLTGGQPAKGASVASSSQNLALHQTSAVSGVGHR